MTTRLLPWLLTSIVVLSGCTTAVPVRDTSPSMDADTPSYDAAGNALFGGDEAAIIRVEATDLTPFVSGLTWSFDFDTAVDGRSPRPGAGDQPRVACMMNWMSRLGLMFPMVDPTRAGLGGVSAGWKGLGVATSHEFNAGYGPGFAGVFGDELKPGKSTYVVVGLDHGQSFLERGSDFQLSITNGYPPGAVKAERIATTTIDCRARLVDFDGGEVIETPLVTAASGLELPIAGHHDVPRMFWAWIGADEVGRIELVDPMGNTRASNETSDEQYNNATLVGCIVGEGDWTIRIPELRSVARPFAWAAYAPVPGVEPETIRCPVYGPVV